VKGLPAVCPVPHETLTASGCGLTFTATIRVTTRPSASFWVTVMFCGPLAGKVVVKLVPDPLDGLPPEADQLNVIGAVPPVLLALHVTGLPEVAEPQLTLRVLGCGLMLTVTLWEFVAPAASVTVTEIDFDPVEEYVTVNVKLAPDPVPLEGEPPGAEKV